MSVGLGDLLDLDLLDLMVEQRYVRRQTHPDLPLAILNYTEQAAYDRVWNDVTRRCRGLIYDVATLELVARPFPKFFNYGEHEQPVGYDLETHRKVYPESDAHHALDLDAPAVVTDKLDGSLGILYPTADGYAVATRGSFTSDQALHATEVWRDRYDRWTPHPSLTYLFEIVYPENRIVVDYAGRDDLFLLAALSIETGLPASPSFWPGPRAAEFRYRTLAEALAAEPRPGVEGLVVYLPDTDLRLKIKQDDYVALHRILTGTNARHVWEYAAVKANRDLVAEPKHWGSYLGIDPARAAQLLEVGDGWLEQAGIPDEFFSWIHTVVDAAEEYVADAVVAAFAVASRAERFDGRKERYEYVSAHAGVYVREVMRMADPAAGMRALEEMRLRAWREACPEPTAPFARSEAVA